MMAATALVRAIPMFFLAAVVLHLFAVRWPVLPLAGFTTPFAAHPTRMAWVADVARHLAGPAAVLAVPCAAGQFLVTRAVVGGQRGGLHLLGARARGALPRQVVTGHVIPGVLPTVVVFAAVQFAAGMGGSAVVETVFSYPGLGALLVDAIAYRDYPVLQACFVVIAVVVIAANLAADVIARGLDPRIEGR